MAKYIRAVYLKVGAPCAGCGVRLKFYGYEKYYYSKSSVDSDEERGRVIQDTKEYIQCDEVRLYEFPGPISIGQYVFPFWKRLPPDLPGSFHMEGLNGARWEAQIVYMVQTEIIDAEEINTCRVLVIYPCIVGVSDGSKAFSLRMKSFYGLGFHKATVTVTARCDKTVYYSGDNVKLSLSFDKEKGLFWPKLNRISFKLERRLLIKLRKPSTSADDSTLKAQSEISRSLSGLFQCCSENTLPEASTIPKGYIEPEDGLRILWENFVIPSERNKLHRGIESMFIPLKYASGHDLPATTCGCHIYCIYYVRVEIIMEGAKTAVLVIPVNHVRQRPTQDRNWKPPEWMFNCEMLLGSHVCSVPADILDSEKFSMLPGFQVF